MALTYWIVGQKSTSKTLTAFNKDTEKRMVGMMLETLLYTILRDFWLKICTVPDHNSSQCYYLPFLPEILTSLRPNKKLHNEVGVNYLLIQSFCILIQLFFPQGSAVTGCLLSSSHVCFGNPSEGRICQAWSMFEGQ